MPHFFPGRPQTLSRINYLETLCSHHLYERRGRVPRASLLNVPIKGKPV
jgi:hypothetical protein